MALATLFLATIVVDEGRQWGVLEGVNMEEVSWKINTVDGMARWHRPAYCLN